MEKYSPLRSGTTNRIALVCMIWRAMSGSGLKIVEEIHMRPHQPTPPRAQPATAIAESAGEALGTAIQGLCGPLLGGGTQLTVERAAWVFVSQEPTKSLEASWARLSRQEFRSSDAKAGGRVLWDHSFPTERFDAGTHIPQLLLA